MGNIYEIKEEQDRVILVGICINEQDDTKASLKELKELVKTAGGFPKYNKASSFPLSLAVEKLDRAFS